MGVDVTWPNYLHEEHQPEPRIHKSPYRNFTCKSHFSSIGAARGEAECAAWSMSSYEKKMFHFICATMYIIIIIIIVIVSSSSSSNTNNKKQQTRKKLNGARILQANKILEKSMNGPWPHFTEGRAVNDPKTNRLSGSRKLRKFFTKFGWIFFTIALLRLQMSEIRTQSSARV